MVMNPAIKYRGGAQVGWWNATWPLASLTCTPGTLNLYVFPFSNYRFGPEQVIAIEEHIEIPVIGSGIRIYHNVPAYSRKIVFWWFGNPQSIISSICESGFVPLGKESGKVMHTA
jgi:hypothetical protein